MSELIPKVLMLPRPHGDSRLAIGVATLLANERSCISPGSTQDLVQAKLLGFDGLVTFVIVAAGDEETPLSAASLLLDTQAREGHVRNVVTAPGEARHKGYATLALLAVERRARRQDGIGRLRLRSRDTLAAKGLYIKLGYSPVDNSTEFAKDLTQPSPVYDQLSGFLLEQHLQVPEHLHEH